jgi:hypothetical protein
MHYCKACNYLANTHTNMKIHYKTKKHLRMSLFKKNDTNDSNLYESQYDLHEYDSDYDSEYDSDYEYDLHDICYTGESNTVTDDSLDYGYYCNYCNNKYKHQSTLSRHKKTCIKSPDNARKISINYKDHLRELEINKLKFEFKRKYTEQHWKNKSAVKDLEIGFLRDMKSNNAITNNNVLNTNITNNNTLNDIKISKIDNLNQNFSEVIDINTFIENYKNRFGLTKEQSLVILENCQYDGVDGCVNALVHYLKKSAARQYKELTGQDIELNNIVLPFMLSDMSLRDHFERLASGQWIRTTNTENIKRLVTLTNDQVYEHHNQHLDISGPQKKRTVNGILKASAYSLLSLLSNPEFYKKKPVINNEVTADNHINNIDDNSSESI